MSSPEMEKFEVTDYDLENEFNPNRRQRRQTKNQATYGIWADPESDEEEERPMFGKTNTNTNINPNTKKEYTLNFVSGGLKPAEKLPGVPTPKEEGTEVVDSEDSEEEKPQIPVKKKKEPAVVFGRFAGTRDDDDKKFGKWQQHTRGIGQKLLEKMGYQKGKGLGKTSQGITEPVEAKKRKRGAGLDFAGTERTQQSLKHFPVQDSDGEEEAEFKDELHQWKREPASENRKPKYIYKTAQEVIDSGASRKKKSVQPSELSKVKVIDMTGKEKRVLHGYHAISQRHDKPDEDEDVIESTPKHRTAFDVPELIHNLNILVDMAELEIIQNDRKHRHNSDQIVNMKYEKERLDAICTQEEKQCNRLQEILDIVDSCEKRTKQDCEDPLTLEECVTLFQKLQNDYYEEYKMYDMGALAIALVFPLVKKFYDGWEPLQDRSKGAETMKGWREILEDNNQQYLYNINNMDVYQRLIWDIWLPVIRRTILSWNVRDCDPVIDLVEIWMPALPSWILENVQDQLILPRLMQEVENWNPLTDTMPIHAWLHPWLPLMGDKLEPLYAPIRHKLANALNNWHPSDSSAKVILLPWVNVFKAGHMEGFLVKNIVPKLELCMQEFVINPHQQILDPFHWVTSWRDLIALPHMVSMLEKAFFPKWLQVLCTWLSNMPNYEEVTNWYLGWKSQFPEEFLVHLYVKEQFSRALDIMNRAASGHFQPGAKENMAYFAHNERRQMGTQALPIPPPPPPGMNMPPLTPSPHQPPPPEYDQNIRSIVQPYPTSFKELVEKMAIDNNLVFLPIPGKSNQGKQVYRFGSAMISFDRNVVFMLDNQAWLPVSLNTLIDSAKR